MRSHLALIVGILCVCLSALQTDAASEAAANIAGLKIIAAQVDTVVRNALRSSFESDRRSSAAARVIERVQGEAAKTIGTRQIFSIPTGGQASGEFTQGGRVVPINSVSENKGIVTQNGAVVSVFISRFFVIIEGSVLFIKDGFVAFRGAKFTVCGNLIAPASVFRCCAGNLYERFDVTSAGLDEIQCCGNTGSFFFPSSEICCSGNFFVKLTILDQATECCVSTFFIPSEEVCCEGSVFSNFPVNEISCCGMEAFHNVFKTCCAGAIVGIETISPSSPCACLNPVESLCCDGVPHTRIQNGVCCGRSQYNPLTQICCGGVPHSRANRACCGNTVITTLFLQCCPGAIPFPRSIRCGFNPAAGIQQPKNGRALRPKWK